MVRFGRSSLFAFVLAAACAAVLVQAACAREIVGSPPPTGRPYFPTGIALHPERPLLAVVSSNFDLAFNRGAILLADLDAVDAAITAADGGFVTLAGATSPYTAVALVPSFGNEPVFVNDGARLLLPTREENIIVEIPLAPEEDGGFDCEVSAELGVPVCGQPPRSLQLPGNDPFELAIVEQSDARVEAIVTLLSSPDVFYVTVDLEDGPRRMQIDDRPSFSLEGYTADGEALGVRGLALRPATPGVPATAFLTVNRTSLGLATDAVDLVWFDANQGDGATLRTLRLTEEIGSIDARDIAIHPDGDALFVLLREPDALVRVDLFPSGGAINARLGGVVSTCYDPIELKAVLVPTPAGEAQHRVLVTCFENDTILAYDALSLVEKEALRGFGDGPYGLAVDVEHVPPRAYVGFFNDDTVGVMDLVNDDGEVALVPRALIVGALPDEGQGEAAE